LVSQTVRKKNEMMHSKKMLGCFNPILGQTCTNPDIGLHF